MNNFPEICPTCGTKYENVEHPMRPGVIMSRLCKCVGQSQAEFNKLLANSSIGNREAKLETALAQCIAEIYSLLEMFDEGLNNAESGRAQEVADSAQRLIGTGR
jgi:hypothetical protein